MTSRIMIAALAVVGAGAADGLDRVEAHRPMPRAAAAPVAKAPWQTSELKAPEVESQIVSLPATRPLTAAERGGDELRSERVNVGYVEPFDAALLPAWPWRARADGSQAGQVELFSPDACGLRVRLEGFDPRAGIEIRFYDPSGATVYGPFKHPTLDDEGGWWSPTIWSDAIGIEFYAARGLRQGSAPQIAKVAYLSLEGVCGTAPGGTLNCHNDVTCSPSWANDEGSGVALIYFVSGSLCGQCSGGLLNRQPNDLSPLFMTANHCVSTVAEANSLEAYWFYETASCNGAAPPTADGQPMSLGAALLKRHSDSDWTLLGLAEPPAAAATYLGWNSANWASGETATGVHHPQGDFKRISFGESRGTSNRQFCDPSGCIDADVRRVRFTDGTTEGGSSGSPIFDSDRLVRGTLTGGDNGCPNVDKYYGRFDLAYDNLKYFMGNSWIASPVHVDGGISGDSGNDGASEQGSAAAPFSAVREATFAVRSGEEVRIEPGTYNQQFRIWRPMTLTRKGSSGVVTIGR